MRQKILDKWRGVTIRGKIGVFTGLVFFIILLSLIFDIWLMKKSMTDFNSILEENTKSSILVETLETETQLFSQYIRNPKEDTGVLLENAFAQTQKAIDALSFDYESIGEERYNKIWSIRNSYTTYKEKRDNMLVLDESNPEYISKLYEVFNIQEYLQSYAKTLMRYTMEEGSQIYQKKLPGLRIVPYTAVAVGILLLSGMIELAALMNRTIINPIMKLAQTAKKIAANDFFVEDVVVENQDEMGELVRAFNKMKYATGEYILALEEKRKTLDLLHNEEMEKLEVEKRLETMKFDVLKNQINPHFLFNTLNVIGGMANLEGAETTEKMIHALSGLFRYNLKTMEIEVPLIQELKVVKDYMYLQEMRFGSRISYQVQCHVDENRVLVPTFTLQPLVENAILHGLAKKEDGGRIRILIREEPEALLIVVGDNGLGMDAETLEQLRNNLKKEEGNKNGIGIANVYKRIYGMYQQSSMAVFSKAGAGTVIKIQIPRKIR